MMYLTIRKVIVVATLASAALALSEVVDPVDVDDSAPVCGPHEFFDACTGCEANCTNPGPIACPKICISPGRCRCIEGYVRAPGGDCVKPEECPGSSDKPSSSTSSPGK
ncbi:salivary secreted serine protease inhibitor [Aphelenchoides avenae]|nr:salivary secreted serine protease inhibitor [Aphelenchus avenae]